MYVCGNNSAFLSDVLKSWSLLRNKFGWGWGCPSWLFSVLYVQNGKFLSHITHEIGITQLISNSFGQNY